MSDAHNRVSRARYNVLVRTIRRIAAIVASCTACLYGFARMKRRLPIVLALAVALAFAASGGPRHARAAAQAHDHAASHTHDASGSGHSHAAASGDFAEGGNHDHVGTPVADQGCCYAWCASIAVIHAAEWVPLTAAHDAPAAFEKPFRIAALSGGIDPPPR
jgi:hypothetical protein